MNISNLMLNSHCNIVVTDSTTNALNQKVISDSTTLENIRCRIYESKETEFKENRNVVHTLLNCILPYNQDVYNDDKIVHNSITYNILSIDENPQGANHHKHLILERFRK